MCVCVCVRACGCVKIKVLIQAFPSLQLLNKTIIINIKIYNIKYKNKYEIFILNKN